MRKVLSLTLLALLSCLSIALGVFGVHFHLGSLVLVVVLTSLVFVLLGITLVAHARSVNEYLLISAGYMLVLNLPLLGWFGVVDLAWFYPLPTTASLVLMEWIKSGLAWPKIVYGLVTLLIWSVLFWLWAKRWFENKVIYGVGRAR